MIKLGIALPEAVPMPGVTLNAVEALDKFCIDLAHKISPIAKVYYPRYYPLWIQAPEETLPDLDVLAALRERGVRPFIFFTTGTFGAKEFRNEVWVNGRYNKYLKEIGRRLALHDHRINIRINQEFNGTYFPWTIGFWNNSYDNFKEMWRVITWQIKSGAGEKESLIRFNWSPTGFVTDGERAIQNFYPGDSWVDTLGFTRYDANGDGMPSLALAYRPMYRELQTINDQMPVIVTETGIKRVMTPAGEPTNDTLRFNWWRQVKNIDDLMPNIRAVIYFNIDIKNLGHFWVATGRMHETIYSIMKQNAWLLAGG